MKLLNSNVRRVFVGSAVVLMLMAGAFTVFGQFAPQQPAPEAPGPEDPSDLGPSLDQPPQDLELAEDELEQFTRALIEVQIIQQDAQIEIQQLVENSDLDIVRFQEIHQSVMTQQRVPEDVEPEEQEAYEVALDEIQLLETQAGEEMELAVTEHELEVDRFNLIAQVVPNDPELANELNELATQIMEEEYADQF